MQRIDVRDIEKTKLVRGTQERSIIDAIIE